MSTSTQASTDVLDGGAPPRARAPLVLLLVAAVLAGAAWLVREHTTADVQDVTGTMVVEVEYERAPELERSDQEEDRRGTIAGSVQLYLPDRTVTGTVEGTTSFSMLPTQTGPVLLHAWGDMTVSLPTTSCRGAYAYSYYHDPAEAGGAVELRCEDGSLLGGELAPTRYHPPDDDHRLWRTALVLDDGWTTLEL